ncbi:MAG: hypothetical protein KDK70_02785 [Myxococcales bacterium]|nr:hypothetical protein [Myxococcales bacterium]
MAWPLLPLSGCPNDDAPTTGTFGDPTTTTTTGPVDLTTSGVVDSGSTVAGTMSASGSDTTGTPDDTGMDTTEGESSSSGEPLPACDQVDDPDINGLDENGDGLDGLAGCSVFVNAAGGSDLNDGLAPDDPVATIARGIEIASSFNPPRPVLVAEGTYIETVNLDSGVSLYGGYDDQTWDRDVFLNETVIAGTEFRTLVAINLSEAVEVDGFTIRGASFNDNSESTYAVWVRDTPEGLLTIDYCVIEAGDAGDGANGVNGLSGEDGGNGANGSSNGNGGAAGVSGCGATGGVGGDGGGCPSTAGSSGSAGGDPTVVGTGGAAGASQCGSDCDDNGTNGVAGNNGQIGVNGVGGTSSMDPDGDFGGDGLWVPPIGATSTRGNHGGGGGGGGAGGFDVDSGVFCLFDSGNGIGGGGGGGGAGGCGGEAGGTGAPGGGSFCVVAVNSSIEITNSDLFLGAGGDGGQGGHGGDGGIGGTAGNGASGTDNGGEPGNGAGGAPGGGGGGGGGGAGGCGGSSIGIVTVGGSSVAVGNVSFTGGSPGTSGSGGVGGIRADGVGLMAPSGANGCAGVLADERDYP